MRCVAVVLMVVAGSYFAGPKAGTTDLAGRKVSTTGSATAIGGADLQVSHDLQVSRSGVTYSNPVIPGDHPDPSIIRVGSDYWATSTTSQWAPVFPLLHSRDLVSWTLEGSVFEDPPAWSAGSYWAPEISEYRGKFFLYYTARKKNGPLCVAVATAKRPQGPWADRGPLVCQDAGSIDASAATGEDGHRYLVWKEDGNSRKQPTPLWLQPFSDDGTMLTGTPAEILRNEAPWEKNLVEGPFILQRDGWFYLFYSAAGCCGRSCDYRLGVARARKIAGPYDRNPSNPILQGNDDWKCPGHGSLVGLSDRRTFLLYHAYQPRDFEYAGRQAMLDEVTWTDGWPVINSGHGPSVHAALPLGRTRKTEASVVVDEFNGSRLDPHWQWPWDRIPERLIAQGMLTLRAIGRDPSNPADTIVARPASRGDYVVTARLARGADPAATAGLSIYGNNANAIGISRSGDDVILWRREKGTQHTVAMSMAPADVPLDLRVSATAGSRFRFATSADGGVTWQPVGTETEGGYLPPWDLAVRVALAARGPAGAAARFEWIRIETRD
jgi:xylan 1,4-beta-xylosidase